jgi:UDP-N-acetylmuramoyl-tripeptide--D-alanyl-D-alanine ligase
MITIEELYQVYLKHPVISTDSRVITSGSLFFALKGDNFDGNAFAAEALEKGAAYTIVDDKSVRESASMIYVDDVLKTLQELALYHRKQLKIPVIGITGTNGKTTTKELIKSVLSQKYRIVASKGNLNNHIGVPVTLLSITHETEIAVVEMGANHEGEINSLCHIALPTHGIITNIGKAHLEGFGGFEGVIRAKTELYRFLAENKGIAFVNKDNKLLTDHAGDLKKITYGSDPSAAFNGSLLSGNQPFIHVLLSFRSYEMTVHSKLYGAYNFENILAAACIGCHFKVPKEKIRDGIENYIPSNNRSQILKTEQNILVLDAYNANPDSLRNAILSFSASSYPAKMIIIGDMLELGKEGDSEHQKILELIALQNFEAVYLVGPDFTRLNTRREWTCFQDSELAKMWFSHHRIEGKTILVKGSRGMKLEKITEEF